MLIFAAIQGLDIDVTSTCSEYTWSHYFPTTEGNKILNDATHLLTGYAASTFCLMVAEFIGALLVWW